MKPKAHYEEGGYMGRASAMGAIVLVAIALGAAFSPSIAEAGSPHPYIRWDTAQNQVEMIISPDACAHLGSTNCQWMLWVNEPYANPPVTVGYQIGSGGTLSIPYPSICGVLQADKLVTLQADLLSGNGHWIFLGGSRHHILNCAALRPSPPASTTQAVIPPVTVAPPPGLPSQATLDSTSENLNAAPVNASIPPTSWIPSEVVGAAAFLILAFLLKTKRLFK
jgi:hypothetical protein